MKRLYPPAVPLTTVSTAPACIASPGAEMLERMRIASLVPERTIESIYRSIVPMQALAHRGHSVHVEERDEIRDPAAAAGLRRDPHHADMPSADGAARETTAAAGRRDRVGQRRPARRRARGSGESPRAGRNRRSALLHLDAGDGEARGRRDDAERGARAASRSRQPPRGPDPAEPAAADVQAPGAGDAARGHPHRLARDADACAELRGARHERDARTPASTPCAPQHHGRRARPRPAGAAATRTCPDPVRGDGGEPRALRLRARAARRHRRQPGALRREAEGVRGCRASLGSPRR